MNIDVLKKAVDDYCLSFSSRWPNEKYKWQAALMFQKNFDINSVNLSDNIDKSIKSSILTSKVSPKRMLVNLARHDQKRTKAALKKLFDLNQPLMNCIDSFLNDLNIIKNDSNSNAGTNYKTSGFSGYPAITLLFLRYPDNVFDQRENINKKVNAFFDMGHDIKRSNKDRYDDGQKIYEEIRQYLVKNDTFTKTISEHVNKTPGCFNDPKFMIATSDFCFWVSNIYQNQKRINKTDNNALIKNSQTQISNAYTKEDFLKEVFISDEQYNYIKGCLEKKKNIILQGPPGVGKTFAAKRLAYSIMKEKDDSRIEFIQFHQNYSYEDFVYGYKPDNKGFRLKEGLFTKLCVEAAKDNRPHFLIIDEINRGNMSKIFGELLMGIENQYRGKEIIHLAYENKTLTIPQNLYIIGMMNTADRSLAIIDYALRRRFGFITLTPAFDSTGFKKATDSITIPEFSDLIKTIKELNAEIEKDESLGEGFCIGHSYFSKASDCDTLLKLQNTVLYEILPTLKEYWFDENEKYADWANKIKRVVGL